MKVNGKEERLRQLGSQVKLLVCDMDGTLLNPRKEVGADTLKALRKMKEAGKYYTICTGRITPMVRYYIDLLEIEVPVITANGAVIWEPLEEKILYEEELPGEELLELLEFCRKHDLDYSALTMGTGYFSRNSRRISRFEQYNSIAAENGNELMQLEYFDDNHACICGQKVFKVLIYELEEGQLGIAKTFINGRKHIGYTSSEPGLLDVAHRIVDKGYGIRKAAEFMNLKKTEICAVGDYFNDIPMLEEAVFPVAMENGCAEIKEKAHYVTGTNEANGIADMIYKFII